MNEFPKVLFEGNGYRFVQVDGVSASFEEKSSDALGNQTWIEIASINKLSSMLCDGITFSGKKSYVVKSFCRMLGF